MVQCLSLVNRMIFALLLVCALAVGPIDAQEEQPSALAAEDLD